MDTLTYSHGETLNVSLTNVADQPVETGNSARYNLQVKTEAGWEDVRVTTGDGFGYADESVVTRTSAQPASVSTWRLYLALFPVSTGCSATFVRLTLSVSPWL